MRRTHKRVVKEKSIPVVGTPIHSLAFIPELVAVGRNKGCATAFLY